MNEAFSLRSVSPMQFAGAYSFNVRNLYHVKYF